MSTANDRQEGGDHYKKREYQHWDFVCDTRMHYLLGCATKYASRWRDKNGIQDLQKMVHYLDKAEERGVVPPSSYKAWQLTKRFCDQLEEGDRFMVLRIMSHEYDAAKTWAGEIIRRGQMPTSPPQA